MKFLDLNGLTRFWNKVKTFISDNYLSLKGGTINGNINISGNVSALQFKKTNGTSTQVLIADGSVKGINSANGVAGLDSNGYVPLSQLGNLDTTVAEVVTALPTTNIKKHIYLIKDASGVTQNQYEEYIYTGDTSAAYDASKWEKLGDFRATVDLADCAKKSDAIKDISFATYGSPYVENLKITKADGTINYIIIPEVSDGNNGLMGITDKRKLDNLDSTYAKKSEAVWSIDVNESANAVDFRYKDINDNTLGCVSLEKASEIVAGVMTSGDRKKLNGIANGATADSAITTAEIDALFA